VKYRIIKNGLGTYRVERRTWRGWRGLTKPFKALPYMDVPMEFDTLETARAAAKADADQRRRWAASQQWSEVEVFVL